MWFTLATHPWGFGGVKSRRRELHCRRRLRRWLDQAAAVAFMGQRVEPTGTADAVNPSFTLCETREKTETFLTRAGADVGWRSARRPRREGSYMHSVFSAVGRRLVIPCRPKFTRTQNKKRLHVMHFWLHVIASPLHVTVAGAAFCKHFAFLDYM